MAATVSLRARLTLLFAGMVVVPLAAAVAALVLLVVGGADSRPSLALIVAVAALLAGIAVALRLSGRYVKEFEASRDEQRRLLDRLGETLRSTLDMDRMLDVMVDTAVATLGARAGALFMTAPSGMELRLRVAKGFDPPPVGVLRIGSGVAGRAAQGRAVLIPSAPDPAAEPVVVEPEAPTAVAVPLLRGGRTIGVLTIYGRTVREPFRERDAVTLASFASQASVAIENVLLHEEAQRLSITDGLTGLWNRRYLRLQLGKEIDRAIRFGRPLSVLLLDLDHFKAVNDTYGHLAGDEILVEVSRRLVESLRSNIDMVSRFGGEEFVILLPETPPEGARVVAEKIRRAVASVPIRVDGAPEPIQVTASIGAASFPDDGTDVGVLLGEADAAMYRAKQGGRDRVEQAPTGAPALGGSAG